MGFPSFRTGETSSQGSDVTVRGRVPLPGGSLDIDVGIDIPGIGSRPGDGNPANMPPGTGGNTSAATVAGISTGTLLGLVGLAFAFRK